VIGITILWFILTLLTVWAVAALYVDLRVAALRIPVTLIYVLGITAILLKVKRKRWAAALCFAGFCGVLGWWLNLRPSNDGDLQPDVDRTAWAEMDGDRVTIHNLRNCDYRTETDYANCWSDRTIYLSQIRAADLFLTNWGLRFASHPIVSFQFRDNEHVAFSIEARYKAGQAWDHFERIQKMIIGNRLNDCEPSGAARSENDPAHPRGPRPVDSVAEDPATRSAGKTLSARFLSV
jgi:hypothetical protein